MDTAFIIGNGESRNIFPIELLKGHGQVWGCNAIYRDHPLLCDHIVAVNPPMYEELKAWHNNGKESPRIYGPDDIVDWNYIIPGDDPTSRQLEYQEGVQSREQNNIYKNSNNYPSRISMKAYLKYEWLFHLRQTFRKYPKTNFYFVNRREYINLNPFIRHYFDQSNIRVGIYADLKRWIDGERDKINWMQY